MFFNQHNLYITIFDPLHQTVTDLLSWKLGHIQKDKSPFFVNNAEKEEKIKECLYLYIIHIK